MRDSPPRPEGASAIEPLLLRYSAERWLRRGRALYYQGDEAEAAYLVRRGRLRSIRVHGEESLNLDEAGQGDWLGLAEVYLGLPYLTDALALEDCEFLKVSRFNFFELLREEGFRDLVLARLARQHYLLHGWLGAGDALGKVARILAAAAAGKPGGSTLSLALTQTEVAEAAGLARETVNRALRKLEERGFIETGRGEILVYDLEGLRGMG